MTGGLSGYFARAVAPVRRLSQAAQRLARGDLTARVPGSYEELDRFFTLSLELLCIADLDGYFRRLNAAFEKTLGYTTEDLLSRPFLEFVHPDDREATLAEVEKLSRGVDVIAFENRYRCKDGSYKWILWNSRAVPEEGLIYAAARDITERKQTEERFRRFIEAAPVASVVVGEDGRIALVNEAAVDLFGYTRGELVGEHVEALVPEASRGVHASHRKGFFVAPQARPMGDGRDLYARRKDGSQFPAEIALSPFETEEGVFVIAAVLDLTERKRAEEQINELNSKLEDRNVELEHQTKELEQQALELEAQQAELERALTNLTDEKELVEAFYAFGQKLLDQTELDALAETILRELADFAEADVGAFYAATGEMLAADAPAVLRLVATRGVEASSLSAELFPGHGLAGRALAESRLVQASYGETGLRLVALGEEVNVQHEVNVPLLFGNQAIGVVTLARVGGRPFAEDGLAAIQHVAGRAGLALANVLTLRSARRLASIQAAVLDASRDAVTLVDAQGHLLLMNAEAKRVRSEVFGLPREGTIYELGSLLAERVADPEGYRASLEELAAHPDRVHVFEWELADSGLVFERYTAPVRDPASDLDGRILVLRDVTRERESERLKSELLATVSHELRTPLSGILGFTELLLKNETNEAKRKRYLETVYSEAERLSALIDDFLDLQKIEAGGFTFAPEPFDLAEVLRDELELFSGQSDGHTLALELPESPLIVFGERERIAQVIANLLTNAVKYSPDGGPVDLAAEARDGAVRVSVADRGLGIPADQQPKVFTKFFRVDSSDTRGIGGTGLGLALCREIITAHGGEIGFDSVEKEGSTFWFELPTGQRVEQTRPQVLVIQDDSAGPSPFADMLGEQYAVEVVPSGTSALERARKRAPDLVCLDLDLPGEPDGVQTLVRLKSSPPTATVPVIVFAGAKAKRKASALGASDVLVKPISPEQLRATAGRLLPVKGGSLLVVDDETSVRRLVRETLSGNGLELREAADGEEALAAISAHRPDAVILDLLMPKLDGFGVLERLRADPETRELPVVVLTARRLSAQERKRLKTQALAVLEKGAYSADELRRLVDRALGR